MYICHLRLLFAQMYCFFMIIVMDMQTNMWGHRQKVNILWLILQIGNVHREPCMSLDISKSGKHLITAGDRVVKVWDYQMRLDLNFQVLWLLIDEISPYWIIDAYCLDWRMGNINVQIASRLILLQGMIQCFWLSVEQSNRFWLSVV